MQVAVLLDYLVRSLCPLVRARPAPRTPAPSPSRHTLPIGGYCFECTVRPRAPPEHLEALLVCMSVWGPRRRRSARNSTPSMRSFCVHPIRIDARSEHSDRQLDAGERPHPSLPAPRAIVGDASHDSSSAGGTWHAATTADPQTSWDLALAV